MSKATCHLCKHYGWNTEHDVFYHDDEEDIGYCIFHAPSVLKTGHSYEEDRENFQLLALGMIQTSIDNNTECNLAGAIFPHYIDFSWLKSTRLPQINLNYAVFEEGANFGQLVFSNPISFIGTEFGIVNFVNCHFSICDFALSKFHNTTTIMGANFTASVNFSYSTFSELVDFSKSKFTCANFNQATFDQISIFNECIFNVNELSQHSASFFNTVFTEKAHFKGATFYSADFSSSQFYNGADFSYSNHLGPFSLIDTYVPDGKIIFHGCNKSSVGFLNFTSKEFEFIKFRACSWPEKIYLEMHSENDPKATTSTDLNELEELYRNLKLAAGEQQDKRHISQWHYREMEMSLAQIKQKRPHTWWLTITWFYWLFSGYGERSLRAMGFLFFFVALPLFLLTIDAIRLTGFAWMNFDPTIIKRTLNNWVHYMPLAKSASGTTWGMWLSQFAISGQAALVGLSLKNRFKR